MSKKIAFAFAALSMLLVLAATMNSASAVYVPIPGVKAGDIADYKVVADPYFPYNRTHITVWGTTGTYVVLTATNYLPDGTLYSVDAHNWSIDWYGGGSWPDAVFYWVLSKNLTVGADEILGAFPGVFVVDNLTMTVAGVPRFVLHATGAGLVVGYFDMYFDRATGLVVQGNYGTPAGWLNVTLISTNVWSAPQPPPGFDLMTLAAIGEGIVIVVLVILTVFLALRMRRKT